MEVVPLLELLNKALQDKLSLALSSLTRQGVTLNLKQAGIMSLAEVHDDITKYQESAITTVYIPITGDVIGDIFACFPTTSALKMVDTMMSAPPGTTTMLNEFEASALKEFGNITTGVVVTELANMLKLSMMLTTPNLATDMASALIDQVLINYAATGTNLLSITLPFNIESLGVEGWFLLLFDKPSSELIKSKLNQPPAPSPQAPPTPPPVTT